MTGTLGRTVAVAIVLGLFGLCGCSSGTKNSPESKNQPAVGAPANAVPPDVQAALESNFQAWSRAGKLGIMIPSSGFQDLAPSKDGGLTLADQGQAQVKSDIVVGSHRLTAGTVLKKDGPWWTIPTAPQPVTSGVPQESKFEGYLSTGMHLATGEEVILFLDPSNREIPGEDATKATASPMLGSMVANAEQLSTSLEVGL